jgi:NAD(P)-dependent dehydrogenase (short-subunit alcohol dehydrogenase family)
LRYRPVLREKCGMKNIVITGVSSGIGRATAQHLIERGFRVFGSVRKEQDAARLKAELGALFTPLIFDTTDEAMVRAGAETVHRALGGEPLYGLIANAGIAVVGPLLHVPPAEFRKQMDVNLTGTLLTVQAFAPLLIGKTPGRIVLISSVAGKTALPFNGPYCISKFGTEAFADALRREMTILGIKVIAVEPGPIQSAIWEKTDAIDMTPFANTVFAEPAAKMLELVHRAVSHALPASKLARVLHRALTVRRPRLRYAVTPDPIGYYAVRMLPARLVDWIVASKIGLKPTEGRPKKN